MNVLGRPVDLDLSRAWLVDPASGREGPGEIVVRAGVVEAVSWLEDGAADGIDDRGVVVAPGFVDLHAHLREPGNDSAETIASGLAAAAHGGFTTAGAMANTEPPIDSAAAVIAAGAAAAASGSPVRLLVHGAVTAGRRGDALAALGEMADAGVVGFSDDGAPVAAGVLFRSALAYAGALGIPLVDHPEDPTLTAGAEASEGLVATVLGLRAWPTSAEAAAVARDLAILRDVVRDVPAARLHLTHVSTAAALDLVRRAKSDGLPVTCDVTPHHAALSDEWVAGARRFAWEALDDDGRRRDPWRDAALDAAPFGSGTRVNPPLRSPEDAAACVAALVDGTADAVATDHAPHAEVDKAVEFGLAANGISGIETALGLLLAAVDAGRLGLHRAVEALTLGPARVIAREPVSPALLEGRPADLVVFDRSARWAVEPEALLSRGKNSPLLGLELPGRVLLTVAGGRLAYEAAG
ncbi:MAG TPA: dihydroorotase [Candidatus Deferrimicrobiaceae bacterium]|nr:dihydroorotase [Candidatus Deferrimicrobiaceae bacterium]